MAKKSEKSVFWPEFGTIELRIAFKIVFFSTIIALMMTVLQISVDYAKDVDNVNRHFKTIENSYLKSLATSLWVMDPNQINTISQGIHSLPDVTYTEVTWDNGETIVSLGERPIDNKLERTFQLLYEGQKGKQQVGNITVVLSLEEVVERSFDRILLILLTNGLKTFAVCIFIFYIVRKHITKNLIKIANYLNSKESPGTLTLHENDRKKDDELAIVVDAINTMQLSLEEHINELKTHKVELEETVRVKTKALKESFEEKTSLLRIVCHDLANPLSIISGSAEILTSLDLSPEKTKERYAAIQRASHMMNEILLNVREMESVASGKKTIKLTPVDLREVFENICFVFRDRLIEKNIQINIDNQLPSGTMCMADPVTLSNQVLSNLISNAIKFSFQDSTIDLIARQEGDQVHIIVRDHGVGMSQEHLAEIFNPKRQTTRIGTEGEVGTGFGMPLVKTFMEKYGGEVEVESTSADIDPEKHGSSFHLYLKMAS
ncbi:ATP-binding protein [Pseudobacteriovorax antillogorgiicola]|uniref:histidine kinase n=1 Tax=Pseudobacteriovorax antillogorgiicola TaxID=1513793 RepID=A0A1Y6CMU9_9BACT|nr:ATP-binding protein [Pseudobacteriovorax antillogorgiicola]TCS47340.1 phospho-acceptor domain-containing protein [Pseudobacteriovorax antillogorgiicola]SMF63137.1 His Kinase A (phospho-acceptor) domain-containing protein [Pseudobacteriovorax antillogorgiicola]